MPIKPAADSNQTIKLLAKHYPDAHCALNFRNPFELIIATILSAQCTDERVNIVTEGLFKSYGTAEKLAVASPADIEEIIRSAGFYKNKTKNIIGCAKALVEKYAGEVPKNIDQLVELPGVGRKTANVVLGNAYGIASGVVVDTHVTRLSNRLGWVRSLDAVEIEKKLNALIPQKHWIMISHWLIWHGRKICNARKPNCQECFLLKSCPRRGVKASV